jgi:hypothetical protein
MIKIPREEQGDTRNTTVLDTGQRTLKDEKNYKTRTMKNK